MAGANVHDTRHPAVMLEQVVVDCPEVGEGAKQNPCFDKGYGNPTGWEAVEAHGYRGHIRRKGEEKMTV